MVGEPSSNYNQPFKQFANFVQQTGGYVCRSSVRSKTNCSQERLVSKCQTCVEQTHPQSENGQDQYLRDTGKASREAFDNLNSLFMSSSISLPMSSQDTIKIAVMRMFSSMRLSIHLRDTCWAWNKKAHRDVNCIHFFHYSLSRDR